MHNCIVLPGFGQSNLFLPPNTRRGQGTGARAQFEKMGRRGEGQPAKSRQEDVAGCRLYLLHGRLDGIDLDKVQELFGGMRAVISFW
jgi:hypothetical protein